MTMPPGHGPAPPAIPSEDSKRPLTAMAVSFVVLVCLSLTTEFV